ncbi:MAG: hypothetical protein IT328_08515 [Caldilineaceae bacterium]|nr:hypothetical protein [Caldilineaceae bacterium]
MYWNRSAADIAAAWQAEIESKLETGATAVLLGGTSSNMITGATTLLALQNSTIQRNDIATPLLVAGGSSALWLGLLLPPQPAGHSSFAPPPTLIYAGADEATYLAVAWLTSSLTTAPGSQPHAAPGAHTGTAQEIGIHFAPRLQPGAPTAWEMLPFVEVGEQPIPPLAMTPVPSDPTADWTTWGVIILAFCLILSALLI